MRTMRDFGNALVVALISTVLTVGALSISLVEFVPHASRTPTAGNVLTSPVPLTATDTPPPTLTPTIGLESPTASAAPTSTITFTPPASCMPPVGWVQITIHAGETLDNIAARYRTGRDQLRSANCLLIDNLVAGAVLYVPPVATNTVAACSPGASGWGKNYTVKPGDTLFSIASNYYVSANLLRSVNCHPSDLIYTGDVLWVPNVATRTPYPTPQPGSIVSPVTYPTDPLTETALPYTITVLPYTATVMPSNTPPPPTVMPSATAMPSPSAFPPP